MSKNGFRPPQPPGEVKIQAVNAAVMVICLCGNPLLLTFVSGFPLTTTCRCKRKLTIGGMQVDAADGSVQVAVAIIDPPLVEPTLGDVRQFGK